MGGMGGMFASQGAQAAGQGAMVGFQTGSGIAHAQYNAAAMRMQAKELRARSDLQAYMIRMQYKSEYQQLLDQQTADQSYNRVVAMKNGMTGASAAAVLGSYAAKNKKNLQQLYYNAAMQTGAQALQTGAQVAALEEKARQYDWQATSIAIGGAINLATGFFDQAINNAQNTTTENPIAGLNTAEDNALSMSQKVGNYAKQVSMMARAGVGSSTQLSLQ